MNIIKKNRRLFLRDAALGLTGATMYSALSSCSSIDDYLFEDKYTFNEEVMIIGGGISGLYLAHQLRVQRTEFRLFEASSSFGGRIKSNGDYDFGASILSENDKIAKNLIKTFSLEVKNVSKNQFYLAGGMQQLSDNLTDKILGLIPYRNFRLRWKLVSIQKAKTNFELIFENPTGQKRFVCKKIALALPPTQWSKVTGLLELPEMKWAREWLDSMKIENTIKLILPTSAMTNLSKAYVEAEYETLKIRQIIKKNKNSQHAELDIKYLSSDNIAIEYIYGALKKKMQINYPFLKLTSEHYYDWNESNFVKGSAFYNSMLVPESINPQFQILGDFVNVPAARTVEGALQSAEKASALFL